MPPATLLHAAVLLLAAVAVVTATHNIPLPYTESPYCSHGHTSALNNSFHIHVVDVNTKDQIYLLRGGQVTTAAGADSDSDEQRYEVDYDNWIDHIRAALDVANIKVDSTPYIIDVNLLNIEHSDDAQKIRAEHQYFEQNPRHGQFVYYDTVGTTANVTELQHTVGQNVVDHLIRTVPDWLPDNLEYRVAQLHQWLWPSEPRDSKQPMVIYVHCVCGCDRTGELIGAYMVRHMQRSWKQVNSINEHVPDRPIGCDQYRALQWYCLHQQSVSGLPVDCSQQLPCSDFSTHTIIVPDDSSVVSVSSDFITDQHRHHRHRHSRLGDIKR